MMADLKGRIRNFKNDFKGTPLISIIEAVINSIQALDNPIEGRISIKINSETKQSVLDPSKPNPPTNTTTKQVITGFEIEDNGNGFTKDSFESFKKLDSDYKISLGCKGIGRLSWLLVFNHATIESWCNYDGMRKHVSFKFDIDKEISDIKIEDTDIQTNKTIVRLVGVNTDYSKKINDNTTVDKLSELILEHCLSYYINKINPEIIVEDIDGYKKSLTELFNEKGYKIDDEEFSIKEHTFKITHLLTTNPRSSANVIYCANLREVYSDKILKDMKIIDENNNNYTYHVYVSGEYFDNNVSSDRSKFNIIDNKEPLDPQSLSMEEIKDEIEKISSNYLSRIVSGYIKKCEERYDEFIENYKEFTYVKKNCPDFIKNISPVMSDEDLYKISNEKFAELESMYIFDFKKAIDGSLSWDSEDERTKFFNEISETQQASLAKYMSHRKYMIDLFEKSLKSYHDADGSEKYVKECTLHDLIMPRRLTRDKFSLTNCNLWMLDERLNYYSFTSSHSDKELKQYVDSDSRNRPDICIFSDKREDQIFAVTIIELKRPDRTDEDVLKQIKFYVNEIKNNRVHDYNGRSVKVSSEAVFYCYVLCDIDDNSLGRYLLGEDFFKMYDGRSYYHWYSNLKANVEFVDFDHLVKDMKIRNALFFNILDKDMPRNSDPGYYSQNRSE